ncbi:MAG: type VI secretion system Vgr family protein [Janthinobacterium lividum]
MNPTQAPSPPYELSVVERPSSVLHVVSFDGEEAISAPWQFTLRIASSDFELADATLIGSTADFVMHAGQGAAANTSPSRAFHGVVRSITWLGASTYGNGPEVLALYEIEIAARLGCLQDFHFSEVYLGQTLNGVLREVLRICGLREAPDINAQPDSDAQSHRRHCHYRIDIPTTEDAYTYANFVCQFEENCLDFVQRRLADAGAYYYFDTRHASSAVFCNDITHLPQTATTLHYRPLRETATAIAADSLYSFSYQFQQRPSQVIVRDFATSRAALDLVEAHDLMPDSGGLLDSCAEHFDNGRLGRRLARMRAEALQCASRRYHGESDSMAVQAGHPITLRHYPHAALNRDYRVIRVRHHGRHTQWQQLLDQQACALEGAWPGSACSAYYNEFEALPHDLPFRTDARACARPRLPAHITAIIEAEADNPYAELNENGCYKVRMPFARTRRDVAHGSAWVPFASINARAHFPLRAGTEVLLGFSNNDPDRPVIVGALANSEHPNVVTAHNPADNLIHTPGDNRLLMHDAQGAQKIEMSSPVADSKIEIGEGAQRGIGLRSAQRVHIESSSYVHRVPGVYETHILPAASNAPASSIPMSAQSLLPSNLSLSMVGGVFVLKTAVSITASLMFDFSVKVAASAAISLAVKLDINKGRTYYRDCVNKVEIGAKVVRSADSETLNISTRDTFVGSDAVHAGSIDQRVEQYFKVSFASADAELSAKTAGDMDAHSSDDSGGESGHDSASDALSYVGMSGAASTGGLYVGEARAQDGNTVYFEAGENCSLGLSPSDAVLCIKSEQFWVVAEHLILGKDQSTTFVLVGDTVQFDISRNHTKAETVSFKSDSFDVDAQTLILNGDSIRIG